MPSGIRNRPRKNGAGIVRNARMPTYGFSVSPRNVIGRRNSQKTAAVVVITTPARLIQLFARCTRGDSHPWLLRFGFSGVIVPISLPWFAPRVRAGDHPFLHYSR